MGAAVVVGLRIEGWRSPIARQIGFWLLVTLVLGASMKHIDNAAHVGGLAAGALIASAWRRGVAYSRGATIACIAGSTLLCVAAGATTAYRDATNPFALKDLDARISDVQTALTNGRCDKARRALVAAEAVGEGRPEVRGLRAHVDTACPPGTQ
jgi:hypothetical protein